MRVLAFRNVWNVVTKPVFLSGCRALPLIRPDGHLLPERGEGTGVGAGNLRGCGIVYQRQSLLVRIALGELTPHRSPELFGFPGCRRWRP
jgi:hypothetical protein